MKRQSLFCFFLLCLMSIFSIAQEQSELRDTRSHFSMGLYTAWNTSDYTLTEGDEELKQSIGVNHAIRAAYRFNFNQKLYAEFGASLGIQTERSYIPIAAYSDFSSGPTRIGSFAFTRYDLLAAYQVYSFNRHSLNVLGGIGANRFVPVGLGAGFSFEDAYFHLNYDVLTQFTPFLNIGASYQMETKRKDLFELKLFYNYGWKSYFDGRYTFENGDKSSKGEVESLLRGVHLGVAYTFTRRQKVSQIAVYQSENDVDTKSAKKQHKIERRAIDVNSQYVSVGMGLGTAINKFNPSNAPFRTPYLFTPSGKISYERGWKNNFFFEADYHGFLFLEGAEASSAAWGGDVFFGHFLSGGINYKVQRSTTNFQFFNVHAGIGMGAQFRSKGDDGVGGGGSNGGFESISFTSSSEIRGNLMPIVYTGISKDIRITEKLLLSLTYRYQFGFNTVYQTDYEVTINDAQPKTVVGKIDGTASMFSLGLKYRIK